ncbi:UNVERIFIED_CONTAM: hypothetical protein FKN15_075635 [Acipenser sinensis]
MGCGAAVGYHGNSGNEVEPCHSLQTCSEVKLQKAYCGHCSERIWGLGRQGYKCINCKLLVHKRCHKLVPLTCQRHMDPVMPSQEPPLNEKNDEVDLPSEETGGRSQAGVGRDRWDSDLPGAGAVGLRPDQSDWPRQLRQGPPGAVKEERADLRHEGGEEGTGVHDDEAQLTSTPNTRCPPKRVPSADRFFSHCRLTVQPPRSYSVGGQRSSGQLTDKPAGTRPEYRGRWCTDIDWVQTEKHVFEQASNNPFLVGLHSCFQTESRLFLVIEYVNGGDLMFHMQRQRKLPEEHARFYAAEICIALNFLHEKGIIYRDLKLDNVLLDYEGHIKLTDYGMCKEGIRPGDTTSTFCGTPNYIAPEILRGEDYGFSVDWWALGVLMFEMTAGRSPFDIITDNPDMNTEEYLFQVILEKPIRIPRSLSVKAASVLKGFLNKELHNLLKPEEIKMILQSEIHVIFVGPNQLVCVPQDPKERLGCQLQTGFSDIKSHTFFRNIDWDQLEKKQVTPPFKPQSTDDYGLDNFDTQFTNEPVQLTPDDDDVIKRIDQSEFEGFEYINPMLLSSEETV